MVLGLPMEWERKGEGGPKEEEKRSGGVDEDVDGVEVDGLEEDEGVAEVDDGMAEEELNEWGGSIRGTFTLPVNKISPILTLWSLSRFLRWLIFLLVGDL